MRPAGRPKRPGPPSARPREREPGEHEHAERDRRHLPVPVERLVDRPGERHREQRRVQRPVGTADPRRQPGEDAEDDDEDQHEADDPELGEALQVERVGVDDVGAHRAIARVVELIGAGARAVQLLVSIDAHGGLPQRQPPVVGWVRRAVRGSAWRVRSLVPLTNLSYSRCAKPTAPSASATATTSTPTAAPMSRRAPRAEEGVRTSGRSAIARSASSSAARSSPAPTMQAPTTTATWRPWTTAAALVGLLLASSVASHAECSAIAVGGTIASSAVGSVLQARQQAVREQPDDRDAQARRARRSSSSVAAIAGSSAAASTRTLQCSAAIGAEVKAEDQRDRREHALRVPVGERVVQAVVEEAARGRPACAAARARRGRSGTPRPSRRPAPAAASAGARACSAASRTARRRARRAACGHSCPARARWRATRASRRAARRRRGRARPAARRACG